MSPKALHLNMLPGQCQRRCCNGCSKSQHVRTLHMGVESYNCTTPPYHRPLLITGVAPPSIGLTWNRNMVEIYALKTYYAYMYSISLKLSNPMRVDRHYVSQFQNPHPQPPSLKEGPLQGSNSISTPIPLALRGCRADIPCRVSSTAPTSNLLQQYHLRHRTTH